MIDDSNESWIGDKPSYTDSYGDTYYHDLDLTADERVSAWVLKQFRSKYPLNHMKECPETVVSFIEGDDGGYGCDTGCEYARLEAIIKCPHEEHSQEFRYGYFGMINQILDEIE